MLNYQNGKVYRIVNDVDEQVYVGSTIQTLVHRMGGHRRDARSGSMRKLMVHMRTVGVSQFRIELLEDFPCERKDQLLAQEGVWAARLKATLNSYQPRGIEAKDRAEYLSLYQKQFMGEYQADYNKNIAYVKVECENCGRTVTQQKLHRHKFRPVCILGTAIRGMLHSYDAM